MNRRSERNAEPKKHRRLDIYGANKFRHANKKYAGRFAAKFRLKHAQYVQGIWAETEAVQLQRRPQTAGLRGPPDRACPRHVRSLSGAGRGPLAPVALSGSRP